MIFEVHHYFVQILRNLFHCNWNTQTIPTLHHDVKKLESLYFEPLAADLLADLTDVPFGGTNSCTCSLWSRTTAGTFRSTCAGWDSLF